MYLHTQDIVNFCSTSKEYSPLLEDTVLWWNLKSRDFYIGCTKESYIYWYQVRVTREKLEKWRYDFANTNGSFQVYLQLFDILRRGLDEPFSNYRHSNGSVLFCRIIGMFLKLTFNEETRILRCADEKEFVKKFNTVILENTQYKSNIFDLLVANGVEFYNKFETKPEFLEKSIKEINGNYFPLSFKAVINRDEEISYFIESYKLRFNICDDPVLEAISQI